MKNNIEFNIEVIIDEYSPYVYKIIDNIVGTSLSYADKEEIISDVFYLLWKNQDKINDNLKSYLATIAKNCTYYKLRTNKNNYEYDDNLKQEIYIPNLDNTLIIEEKINKLNDLEQNIFELYYIKGLKIKEISKLINKNISYIKVKLYRIRKKLKEDLWKLILIE